MFDLLKILDEMSNKLETVPKFMQVPMLAMLIDVYCHKHGLSMVDTLDLMKEANKEVIEEMGDVGLERWEECPNCGMFQTEKSISD